MFFNTLTGKTAGLFHVYIRFADYAINFICKALSYAPRCYNDLTISGLISLLNREDNASR